MLIRQHVVMSEGDRRRIARAVICLWIVLMLAACGTRPPAQGAALIWSEDFSGNAGAPPNSANWNLETGGGGWGNGEWQTYTASRENAHLDGAGNLVITARGGTSGITSARLNTFGKFAFTYGTLSARIRVPSGKGLLPAFWLSGTDIGAVNWPRCGEIDVMETPNTGVQYTNGMHGPIAGTDQAWKKNTGGSLPGVDLSHDFHVYSMTKSPNIVTMSIDGTPVGSYTPASLEPGQEWVFEKPAYILLTLAVGGEWTGPPDSTTPNPASMVIDWIRAYDAD